MSIEFKLVGNIFDRPCVVVGIAYSTSVVTFIAKERDVLQHVCFHRQLEHELVALRKQYRQE